MESEKTERKTNSKCCHPDKNSGQWNAWSMEDCQTDCMGEIQCTEIQSTQPIEENPLCTEIQCTQPTEEHPIQQDKQDQKNSERCSKSDLAIHADLELQEQTQEHYESGEVSEYEEQPQLGEQQEECSKLGEQLQSPYLMSGYEGVPTNTKGISSELCWYCIKSLPSEEQRLPQLQLENDALTSPNGSECLNYLQDPRPHFGVAHSSRSIPFPLWDSEGPREMKREEDEEDSDFVSSCPHCHLGLPLDTLRWHEEKCLLFEGPKKDA